MTAPLKILVVSNYTNTVSCRPEAEIFLALKQKGVDIEIITHDGSEYATRFKEAGIPVYDGHPVKKIDSKATALIRNTLLKGNHRVLFLYNNMAMMNGIKAAADLPVKIVVYRGYHGNINWWDPTIYMKILHPRVDYILCNHEAIQELLEKQPFFRKGKAITIHKGHDLSWYKDVIPADLKELGIPENAFVCTCVANARRMKGIKYLVEAMKYLPEDLPVHFVLTGRGLASKDIMKKVESLPNRKRIHFPGFRKDGLEIVKASDIFVLASIKGESITKAVIEAMCLGKTPVITRIPGNRDLIIHRESGLMVPPKDPKAIAEAILTLYHDRSFCQQLGQNARHRIDTLFNTQRTVEEYYNFLCRISE